MNTSYYKFLELEITHTYFPNNIPKDFRLIPLEQTVRLLKNYDILLSLEANVFSFYCGTSDPGNLDLAVALEDLDSLQFQLVNEDIFFKNYTANTSLDNNDILYLKNSPGEESLQVEHAPPDRDLPPNILGVLLLDIRAIINDNDPEKKLKLFFNSREMLWQYQIVIPESRNIEVRSMQIDSIGDENYEGPVDGTLMETQKTKVMTTDRPVALAQKLNKYPTLKLNYIDTITNTDKALEIKLPNPSPEQISTKMKDGAIIPFLTAIIYV